MNGPKFHTGRQRPLAGNRPFNKTNLHEVSEGETLDKTPTIAVRMKPNHIDLYRNITNIIQSLFSASRMSMTMMAENQNRIMHSLSRSTPANEITDIEVAARNSVR
jgi:hypothetical protein